MHRKDKRIMPEVLPIDNAASSEAIHVRSIHTTRWLWIANDVYDRYATILGPEGLGVYVGLARYANNKTGKCWPSLTRLAADMGTDLYTIEAALERIMQAGLLRMTQEPGKGTVLTLLDAAQTPSVVPPAPAPETVVPTPAPVEESPMSRVCVREDEQDLHPKHEEK